jgi:hypothetical protein
MRYVTQRRRITTSPVSPVSSYASRSRASASASLPSKKNTIPYTNLAYDSPARSLASRAALETWEVLAAKYAYPLTWTARLVVLALMNLRDATPQAVAHIEALRGPTQQRLPVALEDAADGALAAWRRGDLDATLRSLENVLLTARAIGYL